MTLRRHFAAKILAALGVIWTMTTPGAAPADFGDPVAIARVLSDPSAFNLEVVTLVGTIREIRPIQVEAECGGGSGFILYLRDETGELAIRNQGTCVEGDYVPALPGLFARGERVMVRAAIIETPEREAGSPALEASLLRIDRTSE